MDKSVLEPLIRSIAESCNVDPDLACAIAFVETGINATLVRYEEDYNWLYMPEKFARQNGISVDTEVVLQRLSWGPLQCMGANMRAMFYTGMLSLAVQPSIGIKYACEYLRHLQKKYTNELDIISAYNQGVPAKLDGDYKNKYYVKRVVDRLKYLRGERS